MMSNPSQVVARPALASVAREYTTNALPDPVLVTVPQACQLAAIGRTQFYAFVKAGLIRTVRIGKKGVRVEVSELRALPDRLRSTAGTADSFGQEG